jgi:hypothetical protein
MLQLSHLLVGKSKHIHNKEISDNKRKDKTLKKDKGKFNLNSQNQNQIHFLH